MMNLCDREVALSASDWIMIVLKRLAQHSLYVRKSGLIKFPIIIYSILLTRHTISSGYKFFRFTNRKPFINLKALRYRALCNLY